MTGRTALVLSGGGLTGAVYHIGALRALNEALLDRSVNDFDLYVGTSAGAIIASCMANGLRTRDLLRAVSGEAGPLNLNRGDVFRPNFEELARKAVGLPLTTAHALAHYLRHLRDMDLMDFVALFADALPSGFLRGEAIADYLARIFTLTDNTDVFDRLRRELVIIATDLDTGGRKLFGHGHDTDPPISLAAAASAAIPVVYAPVRIGGHDYVDGGVRGTASLDVAVEHGADLIVCVNPLVPFDNRERHIPKLGEDAERVSDKGFSAITNQVSRTMLHAGLHYHLKQLRRAHPEVDVVLIEPKRTDARMFFSNPMRYSSRMLVARHGYESVVVELEENFDRNQAILARHGMTLRRSLVREQLRRVKRAGYDPQIISQVLQARAAAPLEVGARDARWDRLATALELLDREVAYRSRPARKGTPPEDVQQAS
ncbi:MAG TPA: patatin-like phospholipase family protein [Candidatus Dormibacteraeota bacterium]|jgi:predicted acylesterase/phospholipase RssA|nr:patatin-like phospholipase family protein [Candidatus Dormibacteraeota bacterium]